MTVHIQDAKLNMGKSKEVTLTVESPEYPLAPKYERIHFVAHCRFSFVDEPKLEQQVINSIPQMEAQIGYKVFYKGMRIKGVEPLWTDIDFILDVPTESPIAPAILALIIAILGALGIVVVIFMWWTVWHEESELFYCDQCPYTTPEGEQAFKSFKGRADYDAHLKIVHPEKWLYIDEQRDDAYWWKSLWEFLDPQILIILLAIVIVLMFLPVIVSYIPRGRH